MTIREVFAETQRCLNGEKPRKPKEFQKALDALMTLTAMDDIKIDEKTEIDEIDDFFKGKTDEVPAEIDLQILENIQNFCRFESSVSSSGEGIYHLRLAEGDETTSNELKYQMGNNFIKVFLHFEKDETINTILSVVYTTENALEFISEKYNQIHGRVGGDI